MPGDIWTQCKLLCAPTFWIGLSAYVCKSVMLPLICKYWWVLCANVLMAIIICITKFEVWWYKGNYSGNVINVREPHVGFGKMNYDIDPAEVGTNPFGAAFFWHLSSVLIPIEGAGHEFVIDNDLQRTTVNGEDTYCLGMMKQEMTHGTAQLFYSRGVEKSLGYPEGYRYIWKSLLINLLPINLRLAFVLWNGTASFIIQMVCYQLPITFEQLVGEPAWVYTWHILEEAEHDWGAVYELKRRIPWIHVFIIWALMVPANLLLWVQSILQGLWFGLPTFMKHPSRILTAPVFHMTLFFQILIFAVAYTFLDLVLGMRPDKAFAHVVEGMAKQFKPYEHLFKITHTQLPSESLVQQKAPRSSKVSVLNACKSLYEGVEKEMKAFGMTEEQISNIRYYNPLLGKND